jgi:drug/metabolite transporter (DMT)-like permease
MGRYAVLLVVLGSILWGTDSVFRRPLSQELSPVTIVFLEHLILCLLLFPFLGGIRALLGRLNRKHVAALLFISIGGSVVATSIFTYGIKYGNPSVVVLLQKTQPVFAVLLARLFLGEKPKAWFWLCLVPALAGAALVSLPDWKAGVRFGVQARLSIAAALGAACLWGSSTVFGRYVVLRLPALKLTALRLLTALPLLTILFFVQPPAQRAIPVRGSLIALLLAMALFSSLAGLVLYYRGLQETRASVASVAEAAFPLTAVIMNWLVLGIGLAPPQMVGATLLVVSITLLTYLNACVPEAALE